MVISLARTSPDAPTTSRRVEFVPQSSAASAPPSSTLPSITEPAWSLRPPEEAQPLCCPRPHHVVPPGQPPGQMCMQALDPLARASHSPTWTRAVPVVWDQGAAFGGIAAVTLGQRRARPPPPGLPPPAPRPPAADPDPPLPSHQPGTRRQGCPPPPGRVVRQ